jgi:CheY-like chemotaxis protein
MSASTVRILIVEDDELQRELLRSILELAEYEVLEAEDGTMALEMARSERPDLIVTDNYMPGLDGLGLIEAVRKDPELRRIPVVLLTAGDEDAARKRGRTRGLDHFVQKPVIADDLLGLLRSALGSGPGP